MANNSLENKIDLLEIKHEVDDNVSNCSVSPSPNPNNNIKDLHDSVIRVLIIVTGGTIIMAPSKDGLIVQKGYLEKRMRSDPDFAHDVLPDFTVYEWEKPLDSSSFTPLQWQQICKDIESNYHKYDGFVILHGTDTMAYTASALSFMLENLGKCVVITGSQIPIGEVFNDAKNNLIGALCIAGQGEIKEVCVMFNSKLFRGNRITKIDGWHQDAFDSPCLPPLALFAIDLEMNKHLFWNQSHKKKQKIKNII